MKQRILLFDTITDGHHPDFLTNLIGYYCAFPEIDVYVASCESFKKQFDLRQKDEQLIWGPNIHFVSIPAEEVNRVHKKSIYLRSFIEWNLMLKLADQVQASHALLMYFDYFQLGIWLGKRSPIPVSGIYFRPNFLTNSTGFYPRLKKWILKKSLQSGQLKNLFCLGADSLTVIKAMSSNVHVIELCDPIRSFTIDSNERLDFLQNLQLPNHKKIYLNFGFLDDRKGIEVFLKACENLPTSVLSGMCLLLVGPIRADYEPIIQSAISRVPQLEVITRFGYLLAPQVQICFDASDVVLLLYQGHLGSSSVLVRAAKAGKLMFGADQGQIGFLIKQNKFGLVVDSSSIAEVSAGLITIQTNEMLIDQASAEVFVNKNSVQTFGNTIAQGIES